MEFSKRAFFYFAFIALLYSCLETQTESASQTETVTESIDPNIDISVDDDTVAIAIEKTDSTATSAPLKSEDYKVVLETDENLKMNEAGELKVWIGGIDIVKPTLPDKVQDETLIPASIGQYAKITPYAPDFTVTPLEITCLRIHPSGSDVRFTLIPKKAGTLKVSANIELFSTADCTGPAVPKTAATLSVVVKVDNKFVLMSKLQELGTVVWDNFLSFWSALIALLFGALFFIIRRRIKKKTGYDDKDEGAV